MAKQPWDSASERLIWADLCRSDFYTFCDYAIGFGSNPAHSWWTERVHRPFCDWFQSQVEAWEQARARGEARQYHLLVVVHREFGKSMIITKAGQLWMHLRNPDLSTYTGSATVTMAQSFFEPLKAYLTGADPDSRFAWLYGNWQDPSRRWTASELVHGARQAVARSEPSMGTWGVETGLTGTHPDAGFFDDPITYEQMSKDGQWLEKVNTHLAALQPVFRVDSFFVYTGTRYHDADAIGEELSHASAFSIDGMPMPNVRANPEGKWRVYYRAARDDSGEPTYPENWPDWRLKEYEKRHPLQYAAQLMNNPNTGSHVSLTEDQITQLWVDKAPDDLRHSIHIDTAFKSTQAAARGDDSVICHCGHARDGSGDVYFLGCWGSNRWRIEDFNSQLVMLLQRLRRERKWPFILTDELEVGGKYGTWEMTIQSWCHGAGLPAPPIEMLSRGGKRKVSRLLEAASYWVDGHVKLVRGAVGLDRLCEQMLRIGTSVHDDYADAAADVFHPKVYIPARRSGYSDEQPTINRAWDRELLGYTPEQLRELYDANVGDNEYSKI